MLCPTNAYHISPSPFAFVSFSWSFPEIGYPQSSSICRWGFSLRKTFQRAWGYQKMTSWKPPALPWSPAELRIQNLAPGGLACKSMAQTTESGNEHLPASCLLVMEAPQLYIYICIQICVYIYIYGSRLYGVYVGDKPLAMPGMHIQYLTCVSSLAWCWQHHAHTFLPQNWPCTTKHAHLKC